LLVAERTVALGMTVRDSSLRAASALAVCAAVLLVAGCGGGGKGGAKVLGGSNNTSNCTYTKPFGRGRVYVVITVTPLSLLSTACSAFNSSFRGSVRPRDRSGAFLPAGTGRPHCGSSKRGSSYEIFLSVYALAHTGIGRAFCSSHPHPGRSFIRNFSP
jgi:hypothetical protein